MLKNICNYSALLLLSMVVLANSVSAGAVSKKSRGSELINVESKSYNYFNRFLSTGSPQSYKLTVKEGQETSVKIRSIEGVSIKLYLPGGEVKQYSEDKNFGLEFRAAGEYLIEVHSANFSKYTFKTSTK